MLKPFAAAVVLTAALSGCRPVTPCSAAVAAIFPLSQQVKAQAVVWRESRGNPAARGPGGASGCFQLLGHADLIPGGAGARFDAVANVTGAFRLWQGSGWKAWGG